MDPKKLAIISEILEHLGGMEGESLKKRMDSKMPKKMEIEEIHMMPKEGGEGALDAKVDQTIKDGSKYHKEEKPEGMDANEMSDEELEAMLQKYKK